MNVINELSCLQANFDVGAIVSQRLAAIRRLQENPNDSQAISEMYKAQKEVRYLNCFLGTSLCSSRCIFFIFNCDYIFIDILLFYVI